MKVNGDWGYRAPQKKKKNHFKGGPYNYIPSLAFYKNVYIIYFSVSKFGVSKILKNSYFYSARIN